MSELINNRAARREKLKQIIRELHAGATPEEQKEKFKELIKDVGPTEIAELEQELIKEGLPETEIKRLCDVHVAVFKETLNEQLRPDEIPGHPVHTFKKENRAVEAVVQELRPLVEELQKRGPDPQLFSKWEEHQKALLQLDRHYSRKENILFPYLEKHGISGPPSVMWSIHDDIRALLKQVSKTLAEPPENAELLGEFITA
ncbi:MAG TPA: DUF438 domain-containing protein, partial [Verrucomicrobiae bacterium]|nr:DUF438 domain-containing protein [Verrucomicrobiae bacterium]